MALAGDHGYAHQKYAESLEEFGQVRALPRCGGWLLERPVPQSAAVDGVGCYPLFCCRDWNELGNDLDGLADELVCVSLVTDPFADVDWTQLTTTFPDVCYEYKQHYVTDLSQPLEHTVGSHHRRNVRKACGEVVVCEPALDDDLLSQWLPLYDNLARRHAIVGIARFSPTAFSRQLSVPGLTAFSATIGGNTCGINFWYVCGAVAYYHLGAYSDQGYAQGASFALFWNALSRFAERGIRWAALGAGAGTNSAESGLTRFKRGWSTDSRPVFFCGRILQPALYKSLISETQRRSTYFPAYRSC
jgi:Acetyltransferase (GNAT) domain